MTQTRLYPVILSGGSGTRLWPVSRAHHPKQLLPLVGETTMLQETALRVKPDAGPYEPPIVVSNDEHRFMIAAQLQAVGIKPSHHVLEPIGRNTAPAIAAAAWLLEQESPDAVLLAVAADHYISNIKEFRRLVEVGFEVAKKGHLVTFGITPTAPYTGYGYIKAGRALPGSPGAYSLEAFREKPDRATAQSYLDAGGYYWNASIFMFRVDTVLEEMSAFCPAIRDGVKKAVDRGTQDLDFLRLDRAAFEAVPSNSIDYAVMEHTTRAAVIPAAMGWSDIGSWSALWDLGKKDDRGNVVIGDALCVDTRDSYIRGDSRLIATLGVSDLIVVDTPDALLVVDRRKAGDIKQLVDALNIDKRSETREHRRVYRPWGFYESLAQGERHQVKHLSVNPGARLSLQKHHKRAEHWVVVSGTARVTVDDLVTDLHENESIYIPKEAVHRLENPTQEPLSVIEVQSGSYLGEDDIVRLEDDYRRHQEGGKAAE